MTPSPQASGATGAEFCGAWQLRVSVRMRRRCGGYCLRVAFVYRQLLSAPQRHERDKSPPFRPPMPRWRVLGWERRRECHAPAIPGIHVLTSSSSGAGTGDSTYPPNDPRRPCALGYQQTSKRYSLASPEATELGIVSSQRPSALSRSYGWRMRGSAGRRSLPVQ